MTTRLTRATRASAEFQKQLPTPFSTLNTKTDTTARKNLNKNPELQLSPTSTKRELDADFPLPFSSPASSPNRRIRKIAFPLSPVPSDRIIPQQKSPSNRQGGTPTRATTASTPPKPVRSLFGTAPHEAKSENRAPSMPFPNSPSSSSSTTQEQKTDLKSPPPAPSKKARTGAVVSVFKRQYEALCNDTFKYDVTYLAKGSYSNVYTLERTPVQVIAGVNNSTLVLKAFHGEKSGFGERSLRAYLHNAIENYRAIVAAGQPVARIYNVDTAEQDGYIIQQKVSGKVDPVNAQQMLQVRHFFETSLNRNLAMDLMPQNFAFENGQVVLFDFVEDPDDGIAIFHKKAIETWLDSYQKASGTQTQAAAFLNGLSANHYQEYVQELLNRFA